MNAPALLPPDLGVPPPKLVDCENGCKGREVFLFRAHVLCAGVCCGLKAVLDCRLVDFAQLGPLDLTQARDILWAARAAGAKVAVPLDFVERYLKRLTGKWWGTEVTRP